MAEMCDFVRTRRKSEFEKAAKEAESAEAEVLQNWDEMRSWRTYQSSALEQ
jgi:hypothetical protein